MWEIKLWGVVFRDPATKDKPYLISYSWDKNYHTGFSTRSAMLFDKRSQARKWCAERMDYQKRSFRVVRVVQRVEIVNE